MSCKKKELRCQYVKPLDDYIFIKNGYSIMVHLIPFFLVCLLLLVTSLPSGDLLTELATKFKNQDDVSSSLAILLAVIAAVIYFLSLKLQVDQAYLLTPKHEFFRPFLTSLVYAVFCTFMALLVLWSKTAPLSLSWDRWNLILDTISFGDILACFLLAIVSFLGVGWNMPNSLATSMGISSPNYSDARLYVKKIANVIKYNRTNNSVRASDIKAFYDLAQDLQSSIKENMDLEPYWGKEGLTHAISCKSY